jgi:hypothetical protein
MMKVPFLAFPEKMAGINWLGLRLQITQYIELIKNLDQIFKLSRQTYALQLESRFTVRKINQQVIFVGRSGGGYDTNVHANGIMER